MKYRAPLLILMLLSGLAIESARSGDLQRLDPHGTPSDDLHQMNLLKHQECKTCHVSSASRRFRPEGKHRGSLHQLSRCATPQRVQEHMGKSAGANGTITCLNSTVHTVLRSHPAKLAHRSISRNRRS